MIFAYVDISQVLGESDEPNIWQRYRQNPKQEAQSELGSLLCGRLHPSLIVPPFLLSSGE